jgi:hypothetical protein
VPGKAPEEEGFEPPGLQFVAGAKCCRVVFVLGGAEQSDLARAKLPAYITWIRVLRPVSTSRLLRKMDSFGSFFLRTVMIVLVQCYVRIT